jgi:hypothetical protein
MLILAGQPLLGWGERKIFSSGPETDLGGPDETAVLRGVLVVVRLPDKLRGFQLQDGDFNIQYLVAATPFQVSAQIYVKYSRLCYH